MCTGKNARGEIRQICEGAADCYESWVIDASYIARVTFDILTTDFNDSTKYMFWTSINMYMKILY